MSSKPKLTTQEMILAAEKYLAQAEEYEAVTQKGLAEFLNIGANVLYQRLPQHEWRQLQSTWIKNKIDQTIKILSEEDKNQGSLIAQDIARRAKLPLKIVRHFFSGNEGQVNHTVSLPPKVYNIVQSKSSLTIEYIQKAEEYLSITDSYIKATLVYFSSYIGKSTGTVYKHIPGYKWEILRSKWIENRLKQAMDDAYAEAKTQNDFTPKDIARHAAMPYSVVQRFLSKEIWKERQITLPDGQKSVEIASQYALQAEVYFAQVVHYEDINLQHFAEFLGIPRSTARKRLPQNRWRFLRKQWIDKRLKEAINEAYAEAKTQDDFTLTNIARHARMPLGTVNSCISKQEWQTIHATLPLSENANSLSKILLAVNKVYAEAKTQEDFSMVKIAELANVSWYIAYTRAKEEYQLLRVTLPTAKEKILAALQSLVDANMPVSKLTRRYVVEVADVNNSWIGGWFDRPLQAARIQLTQRQKQVIKSPSGMNIGTISDNWIDTADSIWDLRPVGGDVLQKENFRKDIADIVWFILHEEIRCSPEMAISTLCSHYQGFLRLSIFLGDEIPDVHRATLKAIELAWMNFKGTQAQRTQIRPRLVQLFTRLVHLAEHDNTIDGEEMFRISAWLGTITIGRQKLGEEFLSESELNAVIHGCLTDIAAGITYTETHHNLLEVNLHPLARDNAKVLVHWAVALMTLLMAFTGLRRNSVLGLKINDWAEIRQGLCILAWRHNKKVEENVAVLPATLAQQLQLYVRRTVQVRVAFGIESVFLSSNLQGVWVQMPIAQCNLCLQGFVRRHHIERDGHPITLSSTVLRRTYTTRALYEGRNIVALRSQLGHMYLDTTLRYVKFDQYEHPSEVGASLDEYGRKALILWHTPLIIDELDSGKRASLLSVKEKQKQDVGICCHSHCVKALQGSPPPCSLCEHLVTGPEFFGAWKAELDQRKQDLKRLAEEPGLEMMLAQMKYQFEHFEANFAFIQERSRI